MKSFKHFIAEMKELLEAKNLGQSGEAKNISMLKKAGAGGKGSSLSGRGSDATVITRSKEGSPGTERSLELKEKGAAFGQVGFRYSRKHGWHYRAGEVPEEPKPSKPIEQMTSKQRKSHEKKMRSHAAKVKEVNAGRAIAKVLHGLGVNEQIHGHYGIPTGSDKENHIDHVKKKTKGKELHVYLEVSAHHAAKILHTTMNKNDLVNIHGHGVYALHPDISHKTSIPYIGDHIDDHASRNGDVLSVRHRVKLHSSAKNGKPASRSLTAQFNLNKEYLEPSHITLDMAKKAGHKVRTIGGKPKRKKAKK
jgi:hypothetical protein